MVQQAAVALSWDAVLYLGYRMRIPRSPALVPLKDEENHKLGMQLPAEAVSWLSMVRIGTQPMITLPVCEGCLPLIISACALTCALPGAVCPGPKIQAWFQDGRPHIRRGWTRHVCVNKVEWQQPVACVPAAKARLWAAFVQDAGDYNFVNPAITAALIRQPGIVNSKRAMEPFLTTGMGKQTTLALGQAMLPVGQAVLHRYSSNHGHEVYSDIGSTASWAST